MIRILYALMMPKKFAAKKSAQIKSVRKYYKDKIFYKKSGGGITGFSGEPFSQFGFSLEPVKEAEENRLHTVIEICGFVKTSK